MAEHQAFRSSISPLRLSFVDGLLFAFKPASRRRVACRYLHTRFVAPRRTRLSRDRATLNFPASRARNTESTEERTEESEIHTERNIFGEITCTCLRWNFVVNSATERKSRDVFNVHRRREENTERGLSIGVLKNHVLFLSLSFSFSCVTGD